MHFVDEGLCVLLIKLVLPESEHGLLMHLLHHLFGVLCAFSLVDHVTEFGRPDHGIKYFQIGSPFFYFRPDFLAFNLSLRAFFNQRLDNALLLFLEGIHGVVQFMSQSFVGLF